MESLSPFEMVAAKSSWTVLLTLSRICMCFLHICMVGTPELTYYSFQHICNKSFHFKPTPAVVDINMFLTTAAFSVIIYG